MHVVSQTDLVEIGIKTRTLRTERSFLVEYIWDNSNDNDEFTLSVMGTLINIGIFSMVSSSGTKQHCRASGRASHASLCFAWQSCTPQAASACPWRTTSTTWYGRRVVVEVAICEGSSSKESGFFYPQESPRDGQREEVITFF